MKYCQVFSLKTFLVGIKPTSLQKKVADVAYTWLVTLVSNLFKYHTQLCRDSFLITLMRLSSAIFIHKSKRIISWNSKKEFPSKEFQLFSQNILLVIRHTLCDLSNILSKESIKNLKKKSTSVKSACYFPVKLRILLTFCVRRKVI